MAKVLKSYEFNGTSEGRAKYPWADWSDGQIREFAKGDDFACKPQTFAMMARKYAKEHDLKVRVASKGETGIVLQFYSADDNGAVEQPTTLKRRR